MDNNKKKLINTINVRPDVQRVRPASRVIQPRKVGRNIDVSRSSKVARFASTMTEKHIKPHPSNRVQQDIRPPQRHPIAAKADIIHYDKKQSIARKAPDKSPRQIKEEAIAEALSKPTPIHKPKSFFGKHKKFLTILSVGVILLIVICGFAYMNMPSLSVKVASMQAGIEGSYPEYHPDGYSLSSPITSSNGQIVINFRANTGKTSFTITESKSSWDSSAVKEQVEKISKNQFLTTEERGLTIFSYNGNAMWVNGGILYSITGDAPLSNDQIRRIAISL